MRSVGIASTAVTRPDRSEDAVSARRRGGGTRGGGGRDAASTKSDNPVMFYVRARATVRVCARVPVPVCASTAGGPADVGSGWRAPPTDGRSPPPRPAGRRRHRRRRR